MKGILKTSSEGKIETGSPEDDGLPVRQEQFYNRGWNPRYETREEQGTLVKFGEVFEEDEDESPTESPFLQATLCEQVTPAPRPLLLADSSLAAPKGEMAHQERKYRLKRPLEGQSAQDKSSLYKKRANTTFTINLTELDFLKSEELREYDRRAARALEFAANKVDAERKQRLSNQTAALPQMRQIENGTGRPARNVIDNSRVDHGILANAEWKANEFLERQFDAFHCGRPHKNPVLGGSWFIRFTEWAREKRAGRLATGA
ncbi:hypothetical protein E4U41_000651 [Claviceps citrina]|nr:hypothetical protein E4U41_000651 [Claviceps citrina]